VGFLFLILQAPGRQCDRMPVEFFLKSSSYQ
jgi:hypothetical protein